MSIDKLKQECEQVKQQLLMVQTHTACIEILINFARQQQAKGLQLVAEELLNMKWYGYENGLQALRDWCEAKARELEK